MHLLPHCLQRDEYIATLEARLLRQHRRLKQLSWAGEARAGGAPACMEAAKALGTACSARPISPCSELEPEQQARPVPIAITSMGSRMLAGGTCGDGPAVHGVSNADGCAPSPFRLWTLQRRSQLWQQRQQPQSPPSMRQSPPRQQLQQSPPWLQQQPQQQPSPPRPHALPQQGARTSCISPRALSSPQPRLRPDMAGGLQMHTLQRCRGQRQQGAAQQLRQRVLSLRDSLQAVEGELAGVRCRAACSPPPPCNKRSSYALEVSAHCPARAPPSKTHTPSKTPELEAMHCNAVDVSMGPSSSPEAEPGLLLH